jgi:hypothetical protein
MYIHREREKEWVGDICYILMKRWQERETKERKEGRKDVKKKVRRIVKNVAL